MSTGIRVESEPAGAQVWVDGKVVEGETPLELPQVAPGDHTLMLRREGHRDWEGPLRVPESGTVRLQKFRLWPARAVVPEQAAPPDAGPESPPERRAGTVVLVLRTQPDGAALDLDGRVVGSSPMELEVTAETVVRLRASLAGHLDAEREVRVGLTSPQEVMLPLKRKVVAGGTVTVTVGSGGTTVGTTTGATGTVTGAGGGTGLLKVAVTGGKWASVSCNGKSLGDTPFAPMELPSGTYKCKFAYTAEGESPLELSRAVEIKPGQTTFVPVTFP